MPRGVKGKAAKTIVKTGVTTGTAVSLLFLSASAAFAAAAFTKPAFKPRIIRPINLQEKQWVDPQQTAGQAANNVPAARLPEAPPSEPAAQVPPTITLDASSPSGRITPGVGGVMKFTVTTGSRAVYLNGFIFGVNGTDKVGTRWPDRSIARPWTLTDSVGNNAPIAFLQEYAPGYTRDGMFAGIRTVAMTSVARPEMQLMVPANTTRTFTLTMDSSGAAVGDIMGVSMQMLTWDYTATLRPAYTIAPQLISSLSF